VATSFDYNKSSRPLRLARIADFAGLSAEV